MKKSHLLLKLLSLSVILCLMFVCALSACGVSTKLTGIEASAVKTEYEEGESFDVSGLTVTAKYSDGSTSEVTEGYTIDKTGALTVDDTQIKVTYEGQEATVNITVTAKVVVQLTGIEVSAAKTEYEEGESFDVSGLTVTAKYSDGSTSEVTEGYTIDKTGALTVDDTQIKVTYEGQEAIVNITVAFVEVSVTISKDGCADLEVVDGKPYYVIYGSYTGNLQAEHLSHYMERYQGKYTPFSFVRIADKQFRAYADLSEMQQNTLVLPHLYFNGKDAGTDGANVNDNGITCGRYIICSGVRYTIYSKAAGGSPYYGIACVMAEDASVTAVMLSLTCAGLALEDGLPYYVLTGSYVGELTQSKLDLYDGNNKLPCEKLVLDEAQGTFTAHFALKDYTGGQFYPHLMVDGVKVANGVDGGNICSTSEHVASVSAITYNGRTYSLALSANMPTVKVVENS